MKETPKNRSERLLFVMGPLKPNKFKIALCLSMTCVLMLLALIFSNENPVNNGIIFFTICYIYLSSPA